MNDENENSYNRSTSAMVAEFSALRQEIVSRLTLQQAILAASVTATGALVGVVIADVRRAPVLLTIPLIGTALALLYIDNSRIIHALGVYIRTELWPQLQRGSSIPGWEEWYWTNVASRRVSMWTSSVVLWLVLEGPSVAILLAAAAFSIPKLEGTKLVVLFGIDAVVVLAIFPSLWWALRHPRLP